jgi:hypothetical protein
MTARERTFSGVVIEMSCGSSSSERQRSSDALSRLGRESSSPVGAVEHPADLDRVRRDRPVVVAQEAEAPDEPSGLRILGRPWLSPSSAQPQPEALDLRGDVLHGGHVLEELGLRVDGGERLGVRVAPRTEEEPLGAELVRDHRAASMRPRRRERRRPCRAARSGCRTSGDWTHDGQPRSHGQPREQRRRVRDPALELVEAAPRDADPAAWPS